MNRRKLLWAALWAVPVAVVGGLAYAKHSQAKTFTCPITGEELPCPKCCPLNGAKAEGFTCPVTGEQLPCEKCCPLNGSPTRTDAPTVEQAPMPHAKVPDGGFLCPATGEVLPCPKCCPLNKATPAAGQ